MSPGTEAGRGSGAIRGSDEAARASEPLDPRRRPLPATRGAPGASCETIVRDAALWAKTSRKRPRRRETRTRPRSQYGAKEPPGLSSLLRDTCAPRKGSLGNLNQTRGSREPQLQPKATTPKLLLPDVSASRTSPPSLANLELAPPPRTEVNYMRFFSEPNGPSVARSVGRGLSSRAHYGPMELQYSHRSSASAP